CKTILIESTGTACGQNDRFGFYRHCLFTLKDSYSSCYLFPFLHEFNGFKKRNFNNIKFLKDLRQGLQEIFLGQSSPSPVFVIKAWDVFFLSRILLQRLLKRYAQVLQSIDTAVEILYKGLCDVINDHVLSYGPDGLKEIFFVFLILGTDEAEAPGPRIEG